MATACGASSGAATGIVTSQQAGGETAWARALGGGSTALGVAPLGPDRVVVAVGSVDGAVTELDALDATGAVAWSRSITAPCPVSVQPLGALAGGALLLLASAPCAPVVAGLGGDPIAPTGTLVRLDATGAPAGSVGLPSDLATVRLTGATITSTGEVAVLAAGAAALVGADGGERWRRSIPGAERVAAAPDGDVVIAAITTGVELTRVRPDGTDAWTTSLPGGFALRSLAVLTDGAVGGLGTVAGPIAWGRGAAGGSGGGRLALLVVEPDGSPRTAADIAAGDAPTASAAALPHGRVLVHGLPGCDRLRALSPQLAPVWDRTVDAGCAGTVSSVAVSAAGQIVLGGSARGRADFGSGYVLDLPAEAGAPVAVALWP